MFESTCSRLADTHSGAAFDVQACTGTVAASQTAPGDIGCRGVADAIARPEHTLPAYGAKGVLEKG